MVGHGFFYTVYESGSAFFEMSQLYSSLHNLDYTYQFDKLSCVRTMYFVHVTLAYLVTFSGFMCFVFRLFPSTMWLHPHFGRAYIVLMMWLMATSLLLHNTGLPIAVLISFVCVLGGITAGWACIKWHQAQMEQMAFACLNEQRRRQVQFKPLSPNDLREAKHTVASNKSWSERLFSAKAAHGVFMFVSFVNIVGRAGSSHPSGDFVCYTYPVYKQLDSVKFNGSSQALTLVPAHDPDYAKMPWADSDVYWGLELSLGPLAFALLFGAAFSVCAAKKSVVAVEGPFSSVRLLVQRKVSQSKP